MPHMERAGCGRRWGINRIDLFARRVLVEGVGFLLCPALGEFVFEAFERGTIRNVNLCGRVRALSIFSHRGYFLILYGLWRCIA